MTEQAVPQASVGKPPLHQQIVDIDGLDVEEGLKIVMGRWPSYVSLLRRYVDSHGRDPQVLREQLASGRQAEALRTAHTLKGLAGTIGAAQIQAAAARVEAALRTSATGLAEVIALIDALENANDALVKALAGVLPKAADVVADSVFNLTTARETIATLESLLMADDVQAASVFNDNAGLFKAALGADADGIGQLIARFEFDAALEKLRAAAAASPRLHVT
jgi:HPt (histidine-containing phosphotransfer) domain-containing protein